MNIVFQTLVLLFVSLFYGMNVHATNNLITQKVTINLAEAGTLSDKIGYNRKFQIMNLKIIGNINGSDLRIIREMSGCDYYGYDTSGVLEKLDLSEARIVKGGDFYYENHWGKNYTNIDEIGDYAFMGCKTLKEVILPSSIKEIGYYAFYGCDNLSDFDVPTNVENIGSSAFYGCHNLAKIKIPEGVTCIREFTFSGCENLREVSLSSNIEAIESGAFMNCKKIENIILPSKLKSIGSQAFCSCYALTNITIPQSVSLVDEYAFQECWGLLSIRVFWSLPLKINENVFFQVDKKNCVLYVPLNSYQDYWLADGWGDFLNITEFDATKINGAFASDCADEFDRYLINGQKNTNEKGLSIIKYKNGKSKKILIE